MARVTPKKRRYQPPRMGEWHDSLDDIEPDARPERPPEPPPGSGRRRRRKRAVARRSQAPIAPHGGYYYWCEHCDYCNKPEQGMTARCVNHERQDARTRKARQRTPPAVQTSDGAYAIEAQNLAALHARRRALASAARAYGRALNSGNDATAKAARRNLNNEIRAVMEAIGELPEP